MEQSLTSRIVKYISIAVGIIIVILPFHEFLTTWAASNFGHIDLWRTWKELLILLISPFVIYLIIKNRNLCNWFKKDLIVRLILLFTLLTVVLGVWGYYTNRVSKFALADGLIIDLRFFVFFIVMQVVGVYSDFFKKNWKALLIYPALGVIVLGLIQLILPIDFLRHFGYGPNTIPAFATVDQKLQYRRIQSTLRGPNPLGAYMILIIPAILISFKRKLEVKIPILIGSLAVLFFTYSRSAWVGLLVSIVLLAYWSLLNKRFRKWFGIAVIALVVCFGLGVLATNKNHVVENLLFHTDSSSTDVSSNSVRLSALKAGLNEVKKEPLGEGPGSAGPASEHNNHPARIAENFYIQIAQELGWLGLAIFLIINGLVAYRLWQNRKNELAIVLLASFVGISLVNMVSHAWADDTLSLLWWGLAGIALTPAILKKA